MLALIAAGAVACGRRHGGGGKVLPSQISLELGSASVSVPEAIAPRLSVMGVRSFFVPVARVTAAGDSAQFEKLPPPAAPYPLPVYLEVTGTGDFDAFFRSQKEKAADEIWRAVADAFESPKSGRVAGLHLALRVTTSAEEYAEALARLRKKLAKSQTLSVAVFSRLDEESQKKWKSVLGRVDFLVPAVFGRVADATPEGTLVSADVEQFASSDVSLCPLFAPQGWGVLKLGSGEAPSKISDLRINDLSEDRRLDFNFGSLLSNADEDEYVFTAKERIGDPAWGAPPAAAGDSVTFRERRVGDLTASLSAARAVSAKILHLDALDDQDHLIGFSVVEDVLLGKSLVPRILLSRSGGAGEVTFMAINSSSEFSQLSRIGNWIDLRLENGTIGDVRPGDFDRYEFLDAGGNRVPVARAQTIRFFENFVAPGESMTAGPIRYAGAARFFGSTHLTLPDGTVVSTPEVDIQSFPEAAAAPPASAASPQPRAGRGKRLPGRKR